MKKYTTIITLRLSEHDLEIIQKVARMLAERNVHLNTSEIIRLGLKELQNKIKKLD